MRNYRSLRDVNIDLLDYSVFAGPNGAGKSSLLYALEWFFNGSSLEASDVFRPVQEVPVAGEAEEDVTPTVSVSVVFDALTSADRARLAEYGRGETATFSRQWKAGEAKSKTFGNSLAGPGFAAIRSMTKVGEYRPAYAAVKATLPGLPDLGISPQTSSVMQALADWESDPVNHPQLEPVLSVDAAHMFGFNGARVLRECVRFVLVPAAVDIADDVGRSGKGTTLNELVGGLMTDAGTTARTSWLDTHKEELKVLNDSVTDGINVATGIQQKRINERLAALVPNTKVTLKAEVPDWIPKGEATVTTTVSVDDVVNDVTRQGHGLQRAVMIAMFEALAPDEELIRATQPTADGEDPTDAEERLRRALEALPQLVVAIEEPEIYQHPVRARAFARVLSELACQQKSQVVLATHSPYFLRPQQFESLRRFWLAGNETHVTSTTAAKVARVASCEVSNVEKIVAKRLPNAFAEGFFSDAVVLVEGDTDKIILESLGEVLGTPLDALGVSVLDMSGKDGIAVPFRILSEVRTPVYIVADGDWLGHTRKDPAKQEEVKKSHQASTDSVCAHLPMAEATAITGTLPYTFGDPTIVTDRFTIWHDDVEQELLEWPSFIAALAANGSTLRSKDLLAYREAVLDADPKEAPPTLVACVEAIVAFASGSMSTS